MNVNPQRYTKTAILLHWLIGLLLIGMLALGFWMSELPKDTPKAATFDLFHWGVYSVTLPEPVSVRTFYFNLHKSLGVTVLALIVLRILWRLTHAAPTMPATMRAWEKKLAHGAHHLLYLLMVLMPISGFVMSLFSKYGVMWFGMPLVAGLDNPKWRDVFEDVHGSLALLLSLVVVLHVLAALKHQWIDKDNLMQRMSLRG